MLCTVVMDDCSVSAPLLDIKRRLVANGEPDRNKLHATTDSVPIREEVYAVLADASIAIDCTILEKTKAQPQTRKDEPTFYRYAWFYHFKSVGPRTCAQGKKTLITAAALGDKRKRGAFKDSVNSAVQQIVPRSQWELCFIESSQDPCLWVADYCAWAIQRKWERGEDVFYKKISHKIDTEFDLWRVGTRHFY